jgi:hypothetical protein
MMTACTQTSQFNPAIPQSNSTRSSQTIHSYYKPVEKPDYVYSVAIYQDDWDWTKQTVLKFMSERVSPNEIEKVTLGGWRAPDDAQIDVYFWGVKEKDLFLIKIIPDLRYVLRGRAGDGRLYPGSEMK